MLAEFIDCIVTLGRQSQTPEVLTDPQNPRRSLIRLPNGEHEWVRRSTRDYAPTVGSLADLAKIAKGYESAEIYVDSEIRLVLDGDDRNEVVTMPPRVNPVWSALEGLAGGVRLTHQELVRFLRIDLDLGYDSDITRAFSKLDFARRGDGSSTREHGRESLGKSVEATVQGVDKIADRFSVSTPIFLDIGCNAPQEYVILVEIHAGDQVVELIPQQGTLARGRMRTMAAIRDALTPMVECPVYIGTPT